MNEKPHGKDIAGNAQSMAWNGMAWTGHGQDLAWIKCGTSEKWHRWVEMSSLQLMLRNIAAC